MPSDTVEREAFASSDTSRLLAVYRFRSSNLSELLKDVIRRELSYIHPDILHSVVDGFVIRLQCAISCGGGHVARILL
ncbi:hypothetical protein NPIL_466881 [Nephila pilipes]|uniref:Uncharacterized protein n=1 Tax=Nephila pilipes TaxID=299642 RepID=A0A8X6PU77_NEPPI|nr:hypothetical protein NPIL_466881 [Nephila pilipes]